MLTPTASGSPDKTAPSQSSSDLDRTVVSERSTFKPHIISATTHQRGAEIKIPAQKVVEMRGKKEAWVEKGQFSGIENWSVN